MGATELATPGVSTPTCQRLLASHSAIEEVGVSTRYRQTLSADVAIELERCSPHVLERQFGDLLFEAFVLEHEPLPLPHYIIRRPISIIIPELFQQGFYDSVSRTDPSLRRS
jgi:hypothetical protein